MLTLPMQRHANFREWRNTYFPANNKLAVVCIRVAGLQVTFMTLFNAKRTWRSAQLCIFFMMATQVINACFHVFCGIYLLWDTSPGIVTGCSMECRRARVAAGRGQGRVTGASD